MLRQSCVGEVSVASVPETKDGHRQAKEIYDRLLRALEYPPTHRQFINSCREAGLRIPPGIARESLWVMSVGVFPDIPPPPVSHDLPPG